MSMNVTLNPLRTQSLNARKPQPHFGNKHRALELAATEDVSDGEAHLAAFKALDVPGGFLTQKAVSGNPHFLKHAPDMPYGEMIVTMGNCLAHKMDIRTEDVHNRDLQGPKAVMHGLTHLTEPLLKSPRMTPLMTEPPQARAEIWNGNGSVVQQLEHTNLIVWNGYDIRLTPFGIVSYRMLQLRYPNAFDPGKPQR